MGANIVKEEKRRYGTKTKNEMKIAYQDYWPEGTNQWPEGTQEKWIACITYNTSGEIWVSFQKRDNRVYIY